MWGYSSSPDYADDDALDGFNPNNTFLHCSAPRAPSVFISPDSRTPFAFTAGLNTQYGYSPTYSSSPAPTLHRGPLPFAPSLAP